MKKLMLTLGLITALTYTAKSQMEVSIFPELFEGKTDFTYQKIDQKGNKEIFFSEAQGESTTFVENITTPKGIKYRELFEDVNANTTLFDDEKDSYTTSTISLKNKYYTEEKYFKDYKETTYIQKVDEQYAVIDSTVTFYPVSKKEGKKYKRQLKGLAKEYQIKLEDMKDFVEVKYSWMKKANEKIDEEATHRTQNIHKGDVLKIEAENMKHPFANKIAYGYFGYVGETVATVITQVWNDGNNLNHTYIWGINKDWAIFSQIIKDKNYSYEINMSSNKDSGRVGDNINIMTQEYKEQWDDYYQNNTLPALNHQP